MTKPIKHDGTRRYRTYEEEDYNKLRIERRIDDMSTRLTASRDTATYLVSLEVRIEELEQTLIRLQKWGGDVSRKISRLAQEADRRDG